jgi:hypothetical protein
MAKQREDYTVKAQISQFYSARLMIGGIVLIALFEQNFYDAINSRFRKTGKTDRAVKTDCQN